MRPVCLINVVGLTPRHIGENTPHLAALASEGFMTPLRGVVPAVTCTAQASMLTGLLPSEHGIVGNGWHFRELGETRFWVQSNDLIQGEKIYEAARRLAREKGQDFTCAKLFWWYNQGAEVDWSVTPKPHYGADGSKDFDIYSDPEWLGPKLEESLGEFPFFHFWGPRAGLPATDWIARAGIQVMEEKKPTLTLIYLPHLDYDLQRFGPDHPVVAERLREVDARVGPLAASALRNGAAVAVVSEYGIQQVNRAIHPNQVLREKGYLAVREGPFGEMLDPFASTAFAVADHQIAHVYVSAKDSLPTVRAILESVPGVARVYGPEDKKEIGLDHPRAGDLVALARNDSWFTYYYWLDEANAPDFARTVDIHRKPGYDPAELFIDPEIKAPGARIAGKLLRKKLGLRTLMDLIPLDASLVGGSHGTLPADPADGAIFLASENSVRRNSMKMTDVKDTILEMLRLAPSQRSVAMI